MIPERYRTKLEELITVFLAENAHINLSGHRTYDTCYTGNIVDSLALLDDPTFQNVLGQWPDSRQLRALDLGTGGGFPLLPLAITLPTILWTGLDATAKKINALARMIATLQISNVTLCCERAETIGHDTAHREQYDLVTARAIAPLRKLLEYAAPLVRPGGYMIFWKSLALADEIAAAQTAQESLSCALVACSPYTLPEPWGQRQLIVLKKTGAVSQRYPRGSHMILQHPL